MRRVVLAVLVGLTLVLSAATSYGLDASDTATATLFVESVLTLSVIWESTNTGNTDYGTVPNNTTVMDQLIADVTHNMGASQIFSFSVQVDKPVGPAWDSLVRIDDGGEMLDWQEADFGTPQTFMTSVGGSGEAFQIVPTVSIFVAASQASDSYQFDFTLTVTSL
jgi:hypothetical protein